MSLSDPPRSKRDFWAWATVAIALVTAGGTVISRFVALEEARDNNVKWIQELSSEQVRLKDRVANLEKDRALLERIHELERSGATLRALVDDLRDDVVYIKRHR